MKTIFFLFLTLVVISCGNKGDDLNTLNEDELSWKIEEYYTQKDIKNTITCINLFTDKFPQNPKSPEYLSNLALIYTNELKDLNLAVTQYKRIINDFPQAKETPNAFFTLGFIYNNELKDYNSAKYYYEEFIKRYPNHEAVQSARFELETMGKSADDIINKLQNNQSESSK